MEREGGREGGRKGGRYLPLTLQDVEDVFHLFQVDIRPNVPRTQNLEEGRRKGGRKGGRKD
jgi:hypothetical protein